MGLIATLMACHALDAPSYRMERTMTTKQAEGLTPAQQAMVQVWERHTVSEFETKSVDATMETMTANPVVNHVPVMTGGVGREAVRHFYGTYFIPGHPPGTEIVRVSRTIGQDRIVDELIYRATHTAEMPWLLPGIPLTGKRVEIPLVVVVQFEGDKIASEHIYWDQASVLAQIGLLDSTTLPIIGRESAAKVLQPSQVPSNALIERRHENQ